MVDSDTILVSDELLDIVRAAVSYAVEYGAEFVAPSHLLLGLLDDSRIGELLTNTVERGRIVAAARRTPAAGLVQMPEGDLPRGEHAPFVRYDTLVFQARSGDATRWLNRDSFRIVNEAARRVQGGRFLPKHLALGFVNESQTDHEVMVLLGRNPELFTETVFAL